MLIRGDDLSLVGSRSYVAFCAFSRSAGSGQAVAKNRPRPGGQASSVLCLLPSVLVRGYILDRITG